MGEYRTVCRADEIEPGACRGLEIEGQTVALFNVAGTLYAVENTCLHAGGPLHEGSLEGTVVACPWHGWKFDLVEGTCDLNPTARLRLYPVRIRQGVVEIEV
jgi:nitrite reductase (NADH) small subunit/3-phenylpropionate/trans-cinnamate dioxygenase ferredoxin subunit